MTPKNDAISANDTEWEEDGLRFSEMCRQVYAGNNCVFSAGFVEGHAIDTVYLKWEKDGSEANMLLLTPDELAAIVWVGNGALWSLLYFQREQGDKSNDPA